MSDFQYGRKILARLVGIEVDNLRMSFQTREEATKQEQDSVLRLYNLQESTYEQIYKNQKFGPHNIVSIYAGYDNTEGIHEVVTGPIAWVTREAKNGSIITVVTLGDRVYGYGNNWISQSFEGNTDISLIVWKIAESMNLTVKNINLIPNSTTKKNVTLDQFSPDAMRDFLDSIREEVPDLYFYQTGKELVLAKGSDPRKDIGTIVKSPKSGLVGVPKMEEDGRLTVEMLLDTKMKLKGKVLFAESKYIDPEIEYTIDVVSHEGDNWTGKFLTKLECIPPGYVPLTSSGRYSGNKSFFGQSGASRFERNSGRGGDSKPGG